MKFYLKKSPSWTIGASVLSVIKFFPMRSGFALLFSIGLLICQSAARGASPAFNEVFLKATHNSYAANTPVGTISQQLDAGCRVIELDIYDTQLSQRHDFVIGHSRPGNNVRLGDGNPDTPALASWLKLINHWSDAHPPHAPIVLYFDLKKGSGFDNGSLALLNEELSEVFRKKRYSAWEYHGVWPSAESLRGRVITVLTGGWNYRKAYRWDEGQHPAVAMNEQGQVIEINEGGENSLWYWAGQYEKSGAVMWRRHGQLGIGVDPAVALDDHGFVIEMHHMPGSSESLYGVGHLQKDGDVVWESVKPFSADESAKIKFHRATSFPILPQVRAEVGNNRWVAVSTGADAAAPDNTLRYSTPLVTGARLIYEQGSFVEYDQGDPLLDRDGLIFYTAPASTGVAWGRAAREQGKIVRLWQMNSLTPEIGANPPPANYPATDSPYASWYDNYLSSLHFMQ